MEQVLDAVAESRAAVEVNGDPHRLDMEPRWIREARKRGIRFVISTDAHSVDALRNVRYGVDMARRGWRAPGRGPERAARGRLPRAPCGPDRGAAAATRRVFLLSPASLRRRAGAARLQRRGALRAGAARCASPRARPWARCSRFLSGLYFRGKLTYARAFARPPEGVPGVLVITAQRRPALARARGGPRAAAALREGAHRRAATPRYRRPLLRDAQAPGRRRVGPRLRGGAAGQRGQRQVRGRR